MNKNCIIPLVFITDEQYSEPTAVAITSVILNKKRTTSYEINILVYNISKITEEKFKLFSHYKNIKINIIKISDLDKFRGIKQSRYITPTALLKFDLPLLFPKHNKVLYLDGDIFVQSDLSDLYNTDILNYYALVVEDAVTLTPANYHRSSVCLNDKYFNSGVLLMNLEKLKADNCPQKLLEWRENNGEFYMDQDALNEVLGSNVLYADCRFNFITFYPDKHNYNDLGRLYNVSMPEDKIEMYRRAVILHYAGPLKPWKNKMIYLSSLYKYYLKRSPFSRKINYALADNETKIFGNIITLQKDNFYKHCITFSDKVFPISKPTYGMRAHFCNLSSIYTNYVSPIFEEGVPIVYSANNNYVSYLATSIASLKANSSKDKQYDIVILESSISDYNKKKLLQLSDKNFSIRFFNVSPFIKNCSFFLNRYFSAETYYRIFIADIFRLYDKVIYLDCDVLVLCDIAEIYALDLKNNLIAAANDIVSYSHRVNNGCIYGVKRKEYTQEVLGIDDTRFYFQAGVLMFNIKEMLKFGITQKFINKITEIKNPICHDQDILNSVCYRKVLYLPQKWNYYSFFNKDSLQDINILNRYNNIPIELKEEYEYASKHPNIIHFAGDKKVWYNSSVDFGNLWWKYAAKTPFYHRLLREKKRVNNINRNLKFINIKDLIQKFFSVRNIEKHKIITLLGFKIKIRSKNLENKYKIRNLENQIEVLKKEFTPLQNIYSFKINKSINTRKIEYKIKQFKSFGLNTDKRNTNIIVSLTSFPERMYDLHYTIFSLLRQEYKPDKLILWLAIEEFPNGEKDIPQKILNFKQYGLTIKFCNNIRSYKKLIPALKEFPNDIIVTADDDIYYNKDWLGCLVNKYQSLGNNVIVAHRCHQVKFDKYNKIEDYKKWDKCVKNNECSFLNFFTGAGGVLYPPHSLFNECIKEEQFERICPTADDIWFWGMAILNNTKIAITDAPMPLTYTNPYRELSLNGDNILYAVNGKGGNDKQLKMLLHNYPEIKRRINSEKFNINECNIQKEEKNICYL